MARFKIRLEIPMSAPPTPEDLIKAEENLNQLRESVMKKLRDRVAYETGSEPRFAIEEV
jgi:hypothetical protein